MIKYIQVFIFITLFFLTSSNYANDILIKNARIYTLTDKGTIENGFILVKDGKIENVGAHADFDFNGKVIDAKGKSVTPGLVNAYTHIGLVEIYQVSQSLDISTEDKLFGPSFQIAPAINPYSTVIPQNRIHGLTHALVVPEPGHQVFAGQGASIRLHDSGSIILNDSVAVFANFAANGSKLTGGSRAAAYAKIRQSLIDALDYKLNRSKIASGNWREYFLPLHDLEALMPVINGEKPLVVTAHRVSDIQVLLKLKSEFDLRLVIAGASEGWLVAKELADAKVPVIIDPMANLPRDFDQLAARLDSAARMQAEGVTVLFTGIDFMATHAAYQVRQAAGNAAAYGMPVTEAIKAMTLNPAKVFGFANRFGSIEAGKDADLVVWDGHPLELLTRVDRVIMGGKEVSMVSRATRLRDRYRHRGSDYPPAYQK
jgi:imidazolonepropionase-like amidohydrolase